MPFKEQEVLMAEANKLYVRLIETIVKDEEDSIAFQRDPGRMIMTIHAVTATLAAVALMSAKDHGAGLDRLLEAAVTSTKNHSDSLLARYNESPVERGDCPS